MAAATSPGAVTGRLVHEALLYRDPGSLLAPVTTFVRDALVANEPVLVAVPGPAGDMIRERLGAEAAEVQFVDLTDAGRNPGRIIPFVLQSFVGQHPGTPSRVVGEPVWPGRTPEELGACVQHEALINSALSDVDTTILCLYDATNLSRAALADVARTHPVVMNGRGRRRSTRYRPQVADDALGEPLAPPSGPIAWFRFDARTLRQLRQFAAWQATAVGLDADRVDDLLLAVNELAANTIQYAGGHGTLRIWHTDRDLVCEVHDRGRITDPLVGRLAPPPDSAHGRGLVIVNHLCDLVRIHAAEDSTTVRIYFRL